ncbi:MAG: hypothetical protein EA424_00440 [Planctomycetaceae bacterium]|nr:MAG: hypothetical protein EA424_00440 [Planctomycetaceae bacterium]
MIPAVTWIASMATQAAADEGQRPEIGHVIESVEQGGTLTLFAEGLSPDARVWLWQPSPNAASVLGSDESLSELRQMAERFAELPLLPDAPPDDAQVAARFDVPESPRTAMVRQLGSTHPAWDDSPVLPTVICRRGQPALVEGEGDK